ncbi:Opioid growth factor receptor [Pseudocercospora fuligena]|uniref:Opioid growth factor receptor n=1 Tax=Pseudocercospora fuligena TaxID=685502 RepID=A0A8H6R9V0_9PEZI|nr:Opioid growth factor receptor [Pseudocercospora fuligena]
MTNDTKPFIVRFYGSEQAKDSEGRTLDDILQFDNRALEYHHDYIQVLFPLPERSPINPEAPIITKNVRDAFAENEDLREQLFTAFKRMADFYAFDLTGSKDDPKFSPKAQNFKRLASNSWLTSMDHNHLRITRIIRCLRILGLGAVAQGFYEALKQHEEGRATPPAA